MNNKSIFGKRSTKIGCANKNIELLSILLFALLFSVNFAFAISGTSENITLSAGIGAMTVDTNTSTITSRALAPWSTVGSYSGGNINGNFEYGAESSSTTDVTLMTPQNNRIETSRTLSFTYNVSSSADFCSLYIDGVLKGINTIVNLGPNEFIMSGITASKHYWNVSCTSGATTRWSNTQAFSVILLPNFDNVTNITGINMYAIPNFTMEKTGIAKIVFNGLTDLSTGGDMNNNIIFNKHSVTINSHALPNLNRSASITMYDVGYTLPIILRDGTQCGDCTVESFDNQTLTFSVTGFSTYNVTASTRLNIWADTDTIIIRPNNNVTVSASYTNVVTGASIFGGDGDCTISINDGGWSTPESMLWNGSSETYNYVVSFNSSGTRPYTINCTNTIGLDNLAATDVLSISGRMDTLAESIAQVGESSRFDVNNSAANISAQAGNLTELVLSGPTVTQSWQGYYGNITGAIYLQDSTNKTFYNWNMSSVSGEIYASRSININWDNIVCAPTSQLSLEDEFIGANSSIDGDSIFNTFYEGAEYSDFYAGMNHINDAGCYVAHLNDDSGLGSTKFTEVLLTDSNALIYASILNNDMLGFDGRSHDFQILVGENGKDNDNMPTTYYFFLEIG